MLKIYLVWGKRAIRKRATAQNKNAEKMKCFSAEHRLFHQMVGMHSG